VFPLSEYFIDSTHRNWLYRCEMEDTLMDCKIILNDYYASVIRDLSQGGIDSYCSLIGHRASEGLLA